MQKTESPPVGGEIDDELSALDALEHEGHPTPSRWARWWATIWPRAAALAMALGLWEALVLTQWRPEHVLPPPGPVFRRLLNDLSTADLGAAVAVTLTRAAVGFVLALIVGTLVGIAVSSSKTLRTAIGSLISGLQAMPSIAWFPLAILLFQLSESAILFVVVLGAAPAIANGLLSGIDQTPPVLLRAGRVMGARGLAALRYVIFPAALPSYMAGVTQGWAFAWRSLMAGELLVIVANRPSIGVRLQFARELSDAEGMIAAMILILLIGITVDAVFFQTLGRTLRRRRGLQGA